jgi:molybdopterin converting factor small subunit
LKVQIRLFAGLKQYAPTGKKVFHMELAPATTVSRVLEILQFPPTLKPVILVNGYHADEATRLFDGDMVSLFQPVAGG